MLLAAIAHLDAPNPSITATGALLDPHVFHAANLAVHLADVALVFAILRILVPRDLPAAAGALLFALHPVQVEAVAWISEMRGMLAALFTLVCVLLYLLFARARARGSANNWGTRLLFAAALVAAVLAVLSKPSAVALPVILLALDRYLVGRPWRTVLASTAAFFAVGLPLVLVTQTAQPVEPGLLTAPWTRPFIAGDSLAFYLAKLLLPVNLAIDYGRKPGLVAGAWWGYLTWLLPAALGVAIWFLRRRAAWLLGAALVSLAAVAPVLGLLPFAFQHYSDVADRYLYVSMLGPALVLAELLARVGRRATLAHAGTTAWLVVLGFGTIVQIGYWQSTVPLMNRAIEVNPRSDVAYNNRGIVFAQDRNLAAAKRDFESSLRINPKRYDTLSNMGNVLLLQKDTAGAIAQYRASIALKADWDESHANLGAALAKESRWQEAAAEFRIALRLNPNSTIARDGLSQVVTRLPGTPATP